MKIRAIIGSRSLMLPIDSAAEGVVKGTFKTALEDSGFIGQSIAVHGAYDRPCIGISGADHLRAVCWLAKSGCCAMEGSNDVVRRGRCNIQCAR
jgi:hypothetical protein